jgi:multidrug efflux pump subunit AcrA (membrane-fusion protein)
MTIHVPRALQTLSVRRRSDRCWAEMVAAIAISAAAAGCSQDVARTPETRPVRAEAVEYRADGETTSFTGQIRARDQFNVAFRLDGRVIERHADLGDVIAAGQILARLDSQNQQNALRSAEADLAAATTPATRIISTAQANVDSAEAQVSMWRTW